MSRKTNRKAREVRQKAARELRSKPLERDEGAQGAITYLQALWNRDGCEATEDAIETAVCIATTSRDVSHSPEWSAAEREAKDRLFQNAGAVMSEFISNGGRTDVAFVVFRTLAHQLAHESVEAEVKAPEISPQPATDIQTLTKQWIFKSTDPNATPEERDHAKKLIEDYGIGDTRLLQ